MPYNSYTDENYDGNRWDHRVTESGQHGYHYSNRDGSYYYQNPDGSRYYNSGDGYSRHTSSGGKVTQKKGSNIRFSLVRGTNDQGNSYDHRVSDSGDHSYHYSNTDGSYYYSNSDGSTYYNSGDGYSNYTSPDGNSHQSYSSSK